MYNYFTTYVQSTIYIFSLQRDDNNNNNRMENNKQICLFEWTNER